MGLLSHSDSHSSIRTQSRWAVAATMAAALAAACFLVAAHAAAAPAAAPAPAGLVTQDQTALRGSASEGAPQLTLLFRGDALEIRGQRGDYLQVWDHRRERGGWVRQNQVYALPTSQTEAAVADELLSVLRYVRDQPGSEALGLGLAAAAIQALPAAHLAGPDGADVLDAIGQQAERLADRASGPAPVRLADQAALSAHLDVANRHGVTFTSLDLGGKSALCYEGDAWRRLIAAKAARPEQQVRAALALTRPDCQDPAATPRAREQYDLQRAAVLGRVTEQPLVPHWKNRLNIRRASVHASLAFARARVGDTAAAAIHAGQALQALARVEKGELADVDTARYDEAAVRVGAVRWSALPAAGAATTGSLTVQTRSTDDGQTCVALHGAGMPTPLAERCTWGVVWPASATANREGSALALAVQPTEGWRELWIFRKGPAGWVLQVLPPSAQTPALGYAEFAGWVPGGQQVLVAREAWATTAAVAPARSARRFEVVQIDTLSAERTAFEPGALGAFNRWQDPTWKHTSLALR